ncbi:NOV, partial [Symbiodinium pilosum]
DVRAICNVNASLKGVGQTGHKGIGWKSVFRISDCPHVLSREFAFKFDTMGPLGKLAFVTPTNLSDEEIQSLPEPVKEAKDAGKTVMFLPLRAESDAPAVEAELKQIAAQHLCLAFLRRLRRLQLQFPDGRSIVLQRCQAQYAQLYFPDASDITAVKISDADQARLVWSEDSSNVI